MLVVCLWRPTDFVTMPIALPTVDILSVVMFIRVGVWCLSRVSYRCGDNEATSTLLKKDKDRYVVFVDYMRNTFRCKGENASARGMSLRFLPISPGHRRQRLRARVARAPLASWHGGVALRPGYSA